MIPRNAILPVTALMTMAMTLVPGVASDSMEADDTMKKYEALEQAPWRPVFHDSCTNDWRVHWALDGKNAAVQCTPEGMELRAGPTPRDDADHAVLWTQQTFAGDLRIEYEFTRLDQATEFVVILYVQATGSGADPYAVDISAWSGLRDVPSMSHYFNHMHAYHISYAAFDHGNADLDNDYIRARRYMPESGQGLQGTELPPSYDRTGLFERGVPHRITVIKSGQQLYFVVRASNGETFLGHWDNRDLPPITEGRIGLRHMYTRSARYRDIRISVREDPAE